MSDKMRKAFEHYVVTKTLLSLEKYATSGSYKYSSTQQAWETWQAAQAAQAEQSVPVVGEWPHTMDAQVWARKWLEITADKPEVATDEGAMIGWFANAIMAGYDAATAAEGEEK